MPLAVDGLTFSPVGGSPIQDRDLRELRASVLDIAKEHGMPEPANRTMTMSFDGQAARFIHQALPMTPHEASHEEVWSYITCCWLLDVAIWRFGARADERRFVGNVNRNTFRRLWWRAEILGPRIDLVRLGEDEFVNIMERPTIASDRRLARAIASEFLGRVDRDVAGERMQLMREAMKRFMRLTPFTSFSALDDDTLRSVVSRTFDDAAGWRDKPRATSVAEPIVNVPVASPEVSVLEKVVIAVPTERVEVASADEQDPVAEFTMVAQAALAIARRTGRVTNATLREAVPITADDARQVLKVLTAEGVLESRGARRGTHYVVPELAGDESDGAVEPQATGIGSDESAGTASPVPANVARRPVDDALRRLLRRRR
jgi:GGDEF domain-containing protein